MPRFAALTGGRIEYERIEGRTPEIVMLHEGLGSLSLWRDFPSQVARRTGHAVLVYSRFGYGRSSPLRGPRPVRFMHDEALLVLPELLDQLGLARPILFGHSDGGSIAIIHAAGAGRPVAGLLLMAPHVFVEEVTVASIAAAREAYGAGLRERLRRHHDDVDGAFRGWNDVWLRPEFRGWNIEEYLPRIACPVTVVQGDRDEYGTAEQLARIAGATADVEMVVVDGAGHSPHRDRPDRVLDAVEALVARARGGERA